MPLMTAFYPKPGRRTLGSSLPAGYHGGMTNKLLFRAVLFVLLYGTWTAMDQMQVPNGKAIVAGIGAAAVITWFVLIRIAINRAAQD